jgi:hypothetical protein
VVHRVSPSSFCLLYFENAGCAPKNAARAPSNAAHVRTAIRKKETIGALLDARVVRAPADVEQHPCLDKVV